MPQADQDGSDLSRWKPRPKPQREALEGRYVRLEPLSPSAHADGLFEATNVPDAMVRFRWLPDDPPSDRLAFQAWIEQASTSDDPLYFALIDNATGQIVGRQSFLQIEPAHGSVEVGHVYWGPHVSRRPGATEALFLFAELVFDRLGYRRFEWKCNDRNEPSKRAALRFGFKFEGVFRQHMVLKGETRDTAWFSIIDSEWPALRRGYCDWLDPANFDVNGQQRRRLAEFFSEASRVKND